MARGFGAHGLHDQPAEANRGEDDRQERLKAPIARKAKSRIERRDRLRSALRRSAGLFDGALKWVVIVRFIDHRPRGGSAGARSSAGRAGPGDIQLAKLLIRRRNRKYFSTMLALNVFAHQGFRNLVAVPT